MTFLDLQQDAFDRCGFLQTPDAKVLRTFKRYINRWHRKILSSQGMDALRRVVVTQASVADQQTYGIALDEIRYMTDAATGRRIYRRSLGWYRDRIPDPANQTGTPAWYVPMGTSRISARPANASEIFVISTSASDTGTAYAEVIRSTGYRRSLSVTMTGLTGVSLGSAMTDVVDVVDFYLSAAAVGTVTLREDSGTGSILSTIPIGGRFARFYRYALAPTPAAVVTYTIDGIAPIVDLVNDTDEPFPNPDFHDLLVDGAEHEHLKSLRRNAEARDLRLEIEHRLKRLRASLFEWDEETDADAVALDEPLIALPIA